MNTSNVITYTSTLSTILTAQQHAEYVQECHQAAIDTADRRAWVNSRFDRITQDIGALVAQDAMRLVRYTKGDAVFEKEQSFTYAVLVATVPPLMVAGYTSTQLLTKQLAEAFPQWDAVQSEAWATKLIHKFAGAGLVESKVDQHNRIVPVVQFEGDNRLPRVMLSEMWAADFHDWAFDNAGIKLLPLGVMPADWLNIDEGVAAGLGLRLIPKALKGVEVGRKALQGINAMQRVAFVVNDDIQALAQEYLDNMHAFEFDSIGAKEHDERLCRKILAMKAGVKYWLPITCDNRGRMYYRGGQLTPQGKDLAKAAFCFAEAVPLGERGMDALWLTLANTYGIKGSFVDRIANAQQQWASIEHMEWFDIYDVADEPFQCFAVVCEIKRALNAPLALRELYGSRLVCHMDGSQNGYQHQAAILGDRSTAMNTNLLAATEADTPFDAYMAVLKALINTKGISQRIRDLAEKLGRNLVKQPTMTTQYNATVGTFANHMRAKFAAEFEAAGVNVWDMAKAARAAVDQVLPAARALINVYADRFSDDGIYTGPDVIRWTLPDGFEVAMSYKDNEWRTVRAAQSAVVIPLNDGEYDPIDGGKMLRALAANFIQSLDACHMRMIAARSAFPVVGIHDSVGCHAGNFFEVAPIVRQTFVELHTNDVLNQMLNQNGVRPCRFIRKSYDVSEAQNAIYMFS